VWFPNGLVAGWAPYRFGHWGFVAPWGWTWIDDAPWGYAPFHYGRWVMVGGLWGWAPGPVAVTAIYSPALVGFIGGVEVVGMADPVSWVALGWGAITIASTCAAPCSPPASSPGCGAERPSTWASLMTPVR